MCKFFDTQLKLFISLKVKYDPKYVVNCSLNTHLDKKFLLSDSETFDIVFLIIRMKEGFGGGYNKKNNFNILQFFYFLIF